MRGPWAERSGKRRVRGGVPPLRRRRTCGSLPFPLRVGLGLHDRLDVAHAVEHAEELDPVRDRAVEQQVVLEAAHRVHVQVAQGRVRPRPRRADARGQCRGWRERSDRDRRSPRLAEGEGARGYDREPVRGTHRGRRPWAVETGWTAAAETRAPDATKPLAGREASMDDKAGPGQLEQSREAHKALLARV